MIRQKYYAEPKCVVCKTVIKHGDYCNGCALSIQKDIELKSAMRIGEKEGNKRALTWIDKLLG